MLVAEPETDELNILADNDVDGMIVETIRELPAAARKFMVSNPEVMKKQVIAREQKQKRDETKAASSGKKKKKAADLDNAPSDSDDDEEPAKSITLYIQIPKKPPMTLGSKSRSKSSAVNDTLQKGPFTLLSTDGYQQFLSKLASTLPCQLVNIHQSKIQWKSKKPGNAPYLPLGGEAGYPAMITEISSRKPPDRVVLLSMPPPAEPMEDKIPWPTGDDQEDELKFDYSELETVGTEDSIQQQKITFNKATKTEHMKLEEEYPIGNHDQFSDKRIYHDTKTNFYFELNSSRLGVWSTAMAQKKTDEKTPPMDSRFFDANQRIKNFPNAPPAPIPPTFPAPPIVTIPTAGPSMTDLLIASLLSQSGGLGRLFSPPAFQGYPTAPARPSSPTVPHGGPRTAPPSPVRRHSVATEQFCEMYNIGDVDCARLKDVGFRPGDGTEPKADEDLKEAGFTLFSWKRVHQANLRFKADLAAGVFDGQ